MTGGAAIPHNVVVAGHSLEFVECRHYTADGTRTGVASSHMCRQGAAADDLMMTACRCQFRAAHCAGRHIHRIVPCVRIKRPVILVAADQRVIADAALECRFRFGRQRRYSLRLAR